MQQVDPTTAEQQVQDGAVLLDVREPHEWAAGHAEEATSLPLSQLQARIDELDDDQRYVVACRSGGRSSQAVQFLQGNGYDAVNLDGGMQAWQASGRGLVDEHGNEGRVISS